MIQASARRSLIYRLKKSKYIPFLTNTCQTATTSPYTLSSTQISSPPSPLSPLCRTIPPHHHRRSPAQAQPSTRLPPSSTRRGDRPAIILHETPSVNVVVCRCSGTTRRCVAPIQCPASSAKSRDENFIYGHTYGIDAPPASAPYPSSPIRPHPLIHHQM